MKRLKFKATIGVRLTLGFLFIGILTIGIINTSLYVQTNSMLINKFKQNTTEQLTKVDMVINTYFKSVEENAKLLAQDEVIASADNSVTKYKDKLNVTMITPSKNGGIEQKIFEKYKKYFESHPRTVYAYMGTKEGGYIQFPETALGDNYDPTKRPWFMAAMQSPDEVLRTSLYSWETSNGIEGIISTVTTIKDANGQIIGVQGLDASITSLTEMIKEIKIGKTGYIMLLQDDGTIIANPNDETTLFKNISELGIKELDKLDDKSFIEYSKGSTDYYANVYVSPITNWKLVAIAEQNELHKESMELLRNNIIIAVVIFVLIALISTFIARMFSEPIKAVVNSTKVISEGDFTQEMPHKYLLRSDEIGNLVRDIDNMRICIKGMIMGVVEESHNVGKSAKVVADKIGSLSEEIQDVSATTEEMSAGMEETAASTQEMNATSTEIKNAIEMIFEKSEAGMKNAEGIKNRASEVRQGALYAQDKAHEMLEEVNNKITYGIERSKAVQEIDVLSSAIMQITTQTNLLALNASIEAARAGEAGKGFAVVADEIRKLAEDSKNTVTKIQEVTKEVTGAVQQLVTSSKQAIEYLDVNVMKDYQGMVATGEQYYNDAEELNNMVNDFNNTAEVLMESIENMVKAIDEITCANNEAAEGTQNIAINSQEIVKNANDVLKLGKESMMSSEKLIEMVNRFKI